MNFHDVDWCYEQAGEYVLGSLDGDDLREFEEQLQVSPALKSQVLYWQERFQPLADAVVPVHPPADVWDRISHELSIDQPRENLKKMDNTGYSEKRNHRKRRSKHHRLVTHQEYSKARQGQDRWRKLALLAIAASFVLAALLWQKTFKATNRRIQYDAFAIVNNEAAEPLWIIDVSTKHRKVKLTAVAPPTLDDSKSHELWMIRPNDKGVRSLGLLPKDSNTNKVVHASYLKQEKIDYTISIEPENGSPSGAPTGAVVFKGTFTPLQRLQGSGT